MEKCLSAWVEHCIDFCCRTTAIQEEISRRTDLFANFYLVRKSTTDESHQENFKKT